MAQAAAQAPSFATRTPDVVNSGGRLSVSLPFLNVGTDTARNLTLTSIAFGTAQRIEPALPLSLGDLGPDNATAANGIFSTGGLVVGNRYLSTVRGTYEFGGLMYGFTLNRYIVVPAPIAPPVAFLAARLTAVVDLAADTWSYSAFNDEPAGSPRYINAISVDMGGPFLVTGTPAGWTVDTDNLSYVLWYVEDPASPYPDHIAPGSSLNGFQLRSGAPRSQGRGFSITSWNHQTDQADLVRLGTTQTPSGN